MRQIPIADVRNSYNVTQLKHRDATRLKASRDKTIPARHASFEDRPRNVFLTDRRLIDRDSENRSLMSLFDLKGC